MRIWKLERRERDQSRIQPLFPKLLPKAARVRTSDVEPPTFNVLGILQRLRFCLILSLLPKRRFPRLLEIGYGTGIFLPELAQHCDDLYGIDIHPNAAPVLRNLRNYEIPATLLCGSATSLPFDDNTFDCVVAVSCLEYIDQLDNAAREIRRVLRTDGCFVFATPGDSPVVDLGVKLLTMRSTKEHYGNRRKVLIPTLIKSFIVQRELSIPRVGGGIISFYRGMSLGIS